MRPKAPLSCIKPFRYLVEHSISSTIATLSVDWMRISICWLCSQLNSSLPLESINDVVWYLSQGTLCNEHFQTLVWYVHSTFWWLNLRKAHGLYTQLRKVRMWLQVRNTRLLCIQLNDYLTQQSKKYISKILMSLWRGLPLLHCSENEWSTALPHSFLTLQRQTLSVELIIIYRLFFSSI